MAKKKPRAKKAPNTTAKKATAKKATARETLVEPLKRASAAQRREWERAEKEIARLRGGGAEVFDELWETVHAVMSSDPPLYLGGGMKSENAFIAKMLPGEDKRSVARNTLVAIAFTPKDEAEKGLTFLEEVAKYVQSRAMIPPRCSEVCPVER